MGNRLEVVRFAQHGFYARPRLYRWSFVRFAVFDRFDAAFWFVTRRTPPLSLATWLLFCKLISAATLAGFGEKRCRKNLSLYGNLNGQR